MVHTHSHFAHIHTHTLQQGIVFFFVTSICIFLFLNRFLAFFVAFSLCIHVRPEYERGIAPTDHMALSLDCLIHTFHPSICLNVCDPVIPNAVSVFFFFLPSNFSVRLRTY